MGGCGKINHAAQAPGPKNFFSKTIDKQIKKCYTIIVLREEQKNNEVNKMARYLVSGMASVAVQIEVEADNPEDAIAVAYDKCCDLESFVGNGGMDQIVGVPNDVEDMSLDPCGVEWGDADLVETDDDDVDDNDFDDDDVDEMGFNPYEGCYDYDC